jgi:hypothetical protein
MLSNVVFGLRQAALAAGAAEEVAAAKALGDGAKAAGDKGDKDWERYAKAAKAALTKAATALKEAQVRKTPSWPRSWANFSLL